MTTESDNAHPKTEWAFFVAVQHCKYKQFYRNELGIFTATFGKKTHPNSRRFRIFATLINQTTHTMKKVYQTTNGVFSVYQTTNGQHYFVATNERFVTNIKNIAECLGKPYTKADAIDIAKACYLMYVNFLNTYDNFCKATNDFTDYMAYGKFLSADSNFTYIAPFKSEEEVIRFLYTHNDDILLQIALEPF